jgi:hypothetical protein
MDEPGGHLPQESVIIETYKTGNTTHRGKAKG